MEAYKFSDEKEESKLRSRIKENFNFDELQSIYDICNSGKYDNNNDKVDILTFNLRDKGFLELGAGTNRYAMLKDNYVFKFALDKYGFIDNNVEFNMSKTLQPYVTKTYESNGLIAVAEYVNIITKEQFMDNKHVIREILRVISMDYLFADVGSIEKNFRNWGYNDNEDLIILDYGYIFERDDILMRCTKCQSTLCYDSNFDKIICSKCGKKFNIHDVKRMMEVSDEERTEMFEKRKKPLVVDVDIDFKPKSLDGILMTSE